MQICWIYKFSLVTNRNFEKGKRKEREKEKEKKKDTQGNSSGVELCKCSLMVGSERGESPEQLHAYLYHLTFRSFAYLHPTAPRLHVPKLAGC